MRELEKDRKITVLNQAVIAGHDTNRAPRRRRWHPESVVLALDDEYLDLVIGEQVRRPAGEADADAAAGEGDERDGALVARRSDAVVAAAFTLNGEAGRGADL